MDRRSFLKALPAIAAAPVLAPMLPAPALPTPLAPRLVFHKDAFAAVMASVPTRMDVLIGCRALTPGLACRIES